MDRYLTHEWGIGRLRLLDSLDNGLENFVARLENVNVSASLDLIFQYLSRGELRSDVMIFGSRLFYWSGNGQASAALSNHCVARKT